MKWQERLTQQNLQWVGQPLITPPVYRSLFKHIWADLDVQPIALISGPRRTGKSVIVKQLMERLIREKNIRPRQILFFEFSATDKSEIIWELVSEFRSQVANSTERIYLFFDEIQYVSGYEVILKELYDTLGDQAKIIVTGSLSLSYKKRMQESLGGRFFAYQLFPLSFKEYLQLSNAREQQDLFESVAKESDPRQKTFVLGKLNEQFREFLAWGRLPELVRLNRQQADSYIQSVLNQSLTQDAFTYFEIHKPQVLLSLFEYIRANSGGIISLSKISALTGINAETATKYFTVLEVMSLIYVVCNSTNALIKSNSSKKVYVNSQYSLRDTKLDWPTALGTAVESYVLERLLEAGELVTFYRCRNQEVDFLLPRKKLAYEVKYRTQIPPLKFKLKGYETRLITPQGELPSCLF